MIKIESVTIHEIRGIRELTVEPNRENFLVLGPNGSGKSGVVDAIQFALTGGMSRLAGKGTADLSLRRHGPHVDSHDNPDAAEVSLRLYAPELRKSALLTRSVKSPTSFRLEPNDPDISAVVCELARHSEFTLSRREINKYIIVEAAQRSKEIQALLKLDELGNTRSVLKTVLNRLTNANQMASSSVENANNAFQLHLDVNDVSAETVLATVNPHRRILGLDELIEMTRDTDFCEGILETSPQQAFDKASALRDVEALEKKAIALPTLGKEEAKSLSSDLDTLEGDPELLQALEGRSFVERGLERIKGALCPLCDKEWEDEESLRAHLREKLLRANVAEGVQQRLLRNASGIASEAVEVAGLIEPILPLIRTDGPDGFYGEMKGWFASLRTFATKLQTLETIRTQRDRFGVEWALPPPTLLKQLGVLKKAIQDKPDQGASIRAQTFLTIAQDRLKARRDAQSKSIQSAAAVDAANVIYSTYCDVSEACLSELYAEVEDEFGTFYRAINADDESEFNAKLEPAEAGLRLEVDFYDKGMYPPGAYHSEGHQDSMGVCLYLALMRRLLGDRFSFAVLDDVVMSVDQSHRKELCRLLKTRFPDTQFIITTHDKVWAKQMHSEGFVKATSGVAFHSWNVQTGPIVGQTEEIWDQIECDIAKGEIDVASARLRRQMEYVSGELADSLVATPPYRGDFSYDLGDLLPAVIGRHRELLKRAAAAADRWKDTDAQATVKAMKKARSQALDKYGGETWVLNKALHWNAWMNLTKAEFREVVDAFKGILAQYKCTNSDCDSWLYVTPKKGDEESLRCNCGSVSLNLRSK